MLCSGDAASLLTVPQHQPAQAATNMSLVNFDKVQHIENEEELAGVVVDIDPNMHTFVDQANQFQCGYLCKYLVNDVITDGVLIRKENGAFTCLSQNIISYNP